MSKPYTKFTKCDYIRDIKFELSGGVLELEIPDKAIGFCVDKALVEIQRYIDETKMITVPYAQCIDLTDFDHSAIVNVYRTQGFAGDTTKSETTSEVDPMYAQTWAAFSNINNTYNLKSYMMNYLSYNTLLQMQNTVSTDLSFKEDKYANKLYINAGFEKPHNITIEYIPIFNDVKEITSDYWIDIIRRMALAFAKVALGRIRTRFTQSNALWTQDGDKMLEEGNTELKELREILRTNSTYFYPID